jgi:histidinol-phosphate/aromatic aminotransferase/cobyric acid decarboxylase-like protein/choline kinase
VNDDQSADLQAVILTAGYGRRMSPLSDRCHKALLPIAGTTILGKIMDGLAAINVGRVTVVTGYRAEDIERFLRDGYPGVDLRFVHNPRYAETNNVVSLSMALDQLESDVDIVLSECDLLFDPSLMVRLANSPGRNIALVDRYRTGMDGTVVAVQDGLISAVYPADVQGSDFSYADKFKTLNIYRLNREFCSNVLQPVLHTYATRVDSSSYYELVLGMLSNLPAHRINAEIVSDERWVEVDDPNDLDNASFRFEPERRSEILDRAFGGHWNFDVLDFSFMRNAYFPTGGMLAAMRHALPELVADYGSAQPVLNTKLSYVLRCDPSRVQVLHGASQAFPILSQVLGADDVAVPAPTFGEYARAFPEAERYQDAPGIDWMALRQLAARTRICVVVNPNTPTGTTLPSRELHALAAELPGTLFWIDESFIAFSDQPSIVELLEAEPLDNVIVLTSLSKCFGTPGLRLGYVYSADRALVEAVGDALPVWNLSAPAEFLLELLVKFSSAYAQSLVRTAEDREAMRSQLAELPIVARAHPSGGNFMLVELNGAAEDAPALRRWLLEEHRIEVKNVTQRFPDHAPRLRVAVRLPDENARLIEVLAAVPSELIGSSAGLRTAV